jgi:homopolymeric O-antigen transport system permease protein
MPETAAVAAAPAPAELWTIEPRAGGAAARAREVWQYRRMFRFFGERALRKLYQKTVLGMVWIVLRPLIPLLVRVLVFGALLDVGSDTLRVPYFLFLLVGSTAWELFSSCLMWATRSLELNGGLLTRLYVPRLILPIATMVPGFVTFAVHLTVLIVALIYYRVHDGQWYLDPTWLIVAPVATLLIILFALAIGLWTSVLGVGARDVRFGLGYILDFWVYLTPVVYPLTSVPGHAAWAFMLNPMAVLVVAFRGAILGGEGPQPWAWVAVISMIGVGLAAGLTFFHRAEAHAVDSL